jgi:hypothetical protein
MAAIGVTVSHAVEQPEPRQATAEEASLLGIQRAALVTHIRRTYYSDDGRPVETADIVVPAAHCGRLRDPHQAVVRLSSPGPAIHPCWSSSRSSTGSSGPTPSR